MQWNLAANAPTGRGAGRGQSGAGGGTQGAPAAQPPAGATPPAGAPPPATAPGQRGAEPGQPAQPQQFQVGGGRGGGIPVAAGTYLVKVMVGDKVIGQKTVVVEPDTTFMQ